MTDTMTNDVKIEDAGPATKRITITVPAAAIDEKLDDSLATLRNETALPGFRKGRVPQSLIERRFGGAVRAETKNQIIADAYATAIEENEVKPVGDPQPDEGMEDLELTPGQPLTFTLKVEVVPEFEVPSFDGLEIKKPVLEIGESHVTEEIDRQRLQAGTPSEVKGDFEPGDRFVCSTRATKKGDDEPFFTHEEIVVINPESEDGSGQVLGLIIDDLAKSLKGKGLGDSLTIETKGPELHEREDIRGADISIELTLKKAYRIALADIETVYGQYGIPDEDTFKEQVKIALEQRRDQEVQTAMREQLFETMDGMVDFELPENLTASQASRAVQQQEMELLYKGMSQDEVEDQLATFRAESVDLAKQRLKMFFLMTKLASDFNIEVTEQEINGRVAEMAIARGHRPEQLRNELAQAGRLNEVASQIRTHKTADRIIRDAKITEITAEDWQKIVLDKRADAVKSSSKKKTTKKKTTKKKTSSS